MWKEIITKADIEELLHNYGYFHDSCLRDVHISTREYVDERLAMHFDNKNVATLVFQRQFDQNTILELKFEDVCRFSFYPLQPDYNGVIYDVTFKKEEDIYYWADEPEWEIGDEDANWISAKKAYWRYRPGLRGSVTRLKEE
ncbi:hypothetical protein [Sabulibacter ruber]|uniref:hypothetical protein n=1 Tax=Sabulibacter ruber TaxID=2811901 RepID=UPI001A9703CA|nr:hypothetical protein [Sabulibacter ruber]